MSIGMKRSRTIRLMAFACCMMAALLPGSLLFGEDDEGRERAATLKMFDDGNYAMFIHWGIYSRYENRYKGKTYYGIGEWLMNPQMAGIPVPEYMASASGFDPSPFDAGEIARLAKDAGMKYIVITAKHHDGFAMFDSDVCDFNIADATPFGRDPIRELSEACRKEGVGFGFYYSHNQDWTFPGGNNGPAKDAEGNPADFDDYFRKKCLPQVEELTANFGKIDIVWFDTPGNMPKKYVEQLVKVVRKNQPGALVSGRAGHGLGDYKTLGDMEVPHRNIPGLWESVDTTNDSWAFAWYDQNWKTPEEILRRLISCTARGGTYMLNIGPDAKGRVPERACRALLGAGEWLRQNPTVVYGAGPSPWGHALPWGDVTVRGKTLQCALFRYPAEGRLYLPGLQSKIKGARLAGEDILFRREGEWTVFELGKAASSRLIPVLEVELEEIPSVDPAWGVDPGVGVEILAEFAEIKDARRNVRQWMEKFGEWKKVVQVDAWKEGGKAVWEVNVLKPGEHAVYLTYAGKGRIVWGVEIESGEAIRNQQGASHNFQEFPIGWMRFPKAGTYRIGVSCLEGDLEKAALKSIRIVPISVDQR